MGNTKSQFLKTLEEKTAAEETTRPEKTELEALIAKIREVRFSVVAPEGQGYLWTAEHQIRSYMDTKYPPDERKTYIR